MISNMRSPWHANAEQQQQQIPRDEQLDQQVLLGHFMERSTSAPPVSTQQQQFSGGRLMDDNEGRNNVSVSCRDYDCEGLSTPRYTGSSHLSTLSSCLEAAMTTMVIQCSTMGAGWRIILVGRQPRLAMQALRYRMLY